MWGEYKMTETGNELDVFFASAKNNEEKSTDEKKSKAPKEAEVSGDSLEDEFARLLDSFINDSKKQTNQVEDLNLDDYITNTPKNKTKEEKTESLNDDLDSFFVSSAKKRDIIPPKKADFEDNTLKDDKNNLKKDESELAQSFFNFQEGILAIAEKKNIKPPTTDFDNSQLYPNYKPSVGKKIAQYLIAGWDLLNKCDSENMKRLSPNATDEDYLVFAESLEDTDMQLAIISYIEILTNLEICEVKYEQMKEIVTKNRIKKELYEEYIRLQERKKIFIKKLKEQKYPIDVDSLINNYFKAAQKDDKGAFEALTKNPAMFSPIQMDKIKPKFFGIIKVVPEDGIKMNKKIGSFIKKLKM